MGFPNASPVYDVLQSYALTVLCDGDRFAHVQRLRCDPTLADLFGVASIVSDDTIRRFFAGIDEAAGAAWVAAAAKPLWGALPESAWQGPAQRGVLQIAELELRLPGWSRARRVVAGRRLLGVIPAQKAGAFWDRTRHEFDAYVSDLDAAQASGWQIVELYRKRADTENVFDELKHPWGFDGFCSGKKNVTALAARLGLLVYNLWHLFLRLLEPGRHVESKGGRRWFLLIAGRLTQSGRQKQFSIGVAGAWWEQLKAGYQRICRWLLQTAPQLKSANAGVPDFAFLKPAPA